MTVDWIQWYLDALDALEAAVIDAYQWATDAAGDPWVIVGDRSTEPSYPAAFIPTFQGNREETESDRFQELYRIDTAILALTKGDPKDPEANLRDAIGVMGAVKNALYADRSLDRACDYLYVEQATPIAAPTDTASLAGAELSVAIQKKAEHR